MITILSFSSNSLTIYISDSELRRQEKLDTVKNFLVKNKISYVAGAKGFTIYSDNVSRLINRLLRSIY